MTMKKLARIAGVSVSTVSKAFSGSKEISDEKRKRIFDIAKQTGCYGKYCKSEFFKKVIAVICPEFQSGYYSQQLMHFQTEIAKRGGVMLVGAHAFCESKKQELITYFTEVAKVDGLIVYGELAESTMPQVPLVVIGKKDGVDSIVLSGRHAVEEGVKLFVENGHREIAFLGEKLTKTKLNLFRDAMNKFDIPILDAYIFVGEERFEEAGYVGMNQLLSLPNPPTAVFAAYDDIALGAMRSIAEHGLNIPGDISVIGMDDNKENPYFHTALTSITSYNEDFCEIVVDLIYDRMQKGNVECFKTIRVSSVLIKRDSVGRVKKRH